MTKSKREFLFVAEGEGPNGEARSHRVYKSGSSFYLSNPGFREHLCDPSVSSREDIKREIFLVYGTKVTNIRMPWQLDKPSP